MTILCLNVKSCKSKYRTNDITTFDIKQLTIKKNVITHAWKNITSDILKKDWHNLWPLFFSNKDDDPNFEAFH